MPCVKIIKAGAFHGCEALTDVNKCGKLESMPQEMSPQPQTSTPPQKQNQLLYNNSSVQQVDSRQVDSAAASNAWVDLPSPDKAMAMGIISELTCRST